MPEIFDLEKTDLTLLLERCREVLEQGGLAVVPTDTVYGLAAKATDRETVERLKKAKGRDSHKPLVVMVSSREEALELAAPREREALSKLGSFWPGPLTLVVETGEVPWAKYLAPSESKLGIRVPASDFMLRLLEITGPLAVTSANPSGEAAPASFREVSGGLLGKVDLAVDGGCCGSGEPSTVAEIRGGRGKVLRRSEITEEDLRRLLEGKPPLSRDRK